MNQRYEHMAAAEILPVLLTYIFGPWFVQKPEDDNNKSVTSLLYQLLCGHSDLELTPATPHEPWTQHQDGLVAFVDGFNYAFVYGSAYLEVMVVDTQLEPVLIFQLLSQCQVDLGALFTMGTVRNKGIIHVLPLTRACTR